MVEAIENWHKNPELATEQGTNARAAFEAQFTVDWSVARYYRPLDGRPASSGGPSNR